MEALAWLLWAITSGLGFVWSLLWFLISGWVSTLLQIVVLIIVIFYLRHGWRRAPSEIWRAVRTFAGYVWGGLRVGNASLHAGMQAREVVRIVSAKEFGDINLSTLLSLAMLAGAILLAGT
jgi:hypothetical protein